MGTTFRGGGDAAGLAFAVVVSRYNEPITQRLLDGALEVLTAQGAARVDVAWVPARWRSPWLPGAWPRRRARTARSGMAPGGTVRAGTMP